MPFLFALQSSEGHNERSCKRAISFKSKTSSSAKSLNVAASKESMTPETESNILVDGSRIVSVKPKPILDPTWSSLGEGTTENQDPDKENPVTPSNISLTKKWKNGVGSGCAANGSRPGSTTSEAGKVNCGSKKRKRKGWSSLKDVVKSDENENKKILSNLVIPSKL